MAPDTTSSGFFEDRYRRQIDPWNFAGSEYEQGRFQAIVAALQHRRYHRAFEPGCSIGTLTERLAALCDTVDASDFSETAVTEAKRRCADLPNVVLHCAALTPATDLQPYDLVVLSEIGYYFRPEDWPGMVRNLAATMQPDSTVLACHWLGHSDDHCQEGDAVHAVLEAEPMFVVEHRERHPGFRLARLRRCHAIGTL